MKRAFASGAVALAMSFAASAQSLDLPDAKPTDAGVAKSKKPDDLGLDMTLDGAKPAAAAKKDKKKTKTPVIPPSPATDMALTIPAAPPGTSTTTTVTSTTTPPADAAKAPADASKSASATTDSSKTGATAAGAAQSTPATGSSSAAATTTTTTVTTSTTPAPTPAPAPPLAKPATTPPPAAASTTAARPAAGGSVTLGARAPAPAPVTLDRQGAPAGQRGYPSVTPVVPQEKTLWSAQLFVGAERSTEQYMNDSSSVLRVGLGGSRNITDNFLAMASFDFRTYKQGYAINATTSNGPVLLDEQRYDLAAGVGYDFGPRILDSGRLRLMPALQFRFMRLQNDVFPTSLFGIEFGGRFAFELSSAVGVHAGFGYTFNFTQSDTQSGVGAPRGLAIWSAGLDLPLAGGYALALNYEGNIIALGNVYRVAQGASLGFGYSF